MKFIKCLLAVGAAAAAIGICAICARQCRSGCSDARQTQDQADVQHIVAALNSNLWARPLTAYRPLQELDEGLRVLATPDSRRDFLAECADCFLKMDVNLEKRVHAQNNSDNYICFAERLFRLMVSNEVDDVVCMDFFMRALEKHKLICLSGIPREAELDYRTWAAWNEVLDWLQVNLKSDLVHLHGELKESRFMGQRKDLEAELFRRFEAFYVPATNEIANQIFSRRRHPRRPPPIELTKQPTTHDAGQGQSWHERDAEAQ